jgi:hypothetical protein
MGLVKADNMSINFATESNIWVDDNFQRLAEIIKDYDPYLELRWIPPGQRETDAEKKNPYCIVDTRSNYIVMFASERDTPESILSRLFQADNKHGSVLDRLDADNAAKEAFRLKSLMDEEELKKDFTAFLIGTKQNYIKTRNPITGEKVKFDDQLRRI